MKDLVGLLVHGVEACTAPCPASTFLSTCRRRARSHEARWVQARPCRTQSWARQCSAATRCTDSGRHEPASVAARLRRVQPGKVTQACSRTCPKSPRSPHGGGQALTRKSNSTESSSRGAGKRIPLKDFVKHPTTSVETAPPGDTTTSDNAPDPATLASTYAVPCVPRDTAKHPSAALFNSPCTPSRFASSNR